MRKMDRDLKYRFLRYFNELNQLKSLPNSISSISWMFVAICVFSTVTFILHPTVSEFLIMVLVDTVAYTLNHPFEIRLFQWIFPDTKIYFNSLDNKEIESLSTSEKVALFESFCKFPMRRAIFGYFESYIKGIPAFCIVVFYWKHSVSNMEQLGLMAGIILMNYCYFFGAVFLESHIFVSNQIAYLHEKYDFSEVFQKAPLSYSKREFEIQETLAIAAVAFFALVLQGVVIHSSTSQAELLVKLLVVTIAAIILFSRLWYLSRTLFVGGLEYLFNQMGEVDFKRSWKSLPLHTSPLLAQFEKAFNLLSWRVRRSEMELSALVMQEADKSRYNTIGEMSALIAHDLAGPLHVIRFCAEEMKEQTNNENINSLVDRISINALQAAQLVHSLKARLKNSAIESTMSKFIDAHQYVITLLGTQFAKSKFNKIQFLLNPGVEALVFKMRQTELIQILDNLYKNSVKNLLNNKIESPFIALSLLEIQNGFVTLKVEDNGTGLTFEEFERMTAFRFTSSDVGTGQEALGLRLTRRLIEYYGGELQLVESALCGGQGGTTFTMKLKLHDQNQEREYSVLSHVEATGLRSELDGGVSEMGRTD